MKLRESLRKFRFRSLQGGEGVRSEDNVDAMATTSPGGYSPGDFYSAAPSAPTNWVPSQQDEKPRY